MVPKRAAGLTTLHTFYLCSTCDPDSHKANTKMIGSERQDELSIPTFTGTCAPHQDSPQQLSLGAVTFEGLGGAVDGAKNIHLLDLNVEVFGVGEIARGILQVRFRGQTRNAHGNTMTTPWRAYLHKPQPKVTKFVHQNEPRIAHLRVFPENFDFRHWHQNS